MYISCFLGFLIIFFYCIIVAIKNKEMPNSISQTVYMLSEKWKWLFTVVMFVAAFMIAPQLMTVASAYGCEFLSYLTVAGILGVGVDPLVKNEKNIIHYASAVIMGASSQTLVLLVNPWFLLSWVPYICYTLYMEDGSKNMFVGEMSMYSNTCMVCLL